MSKPMSEQMQKLAARYEKATGKKFNAKTNAQKIRATTAWRIVPNIGYTGSSGQRRRNRNEHYQKTLHCYA